MNKQLSKISKKTRGSFPLTILNSKALVRKKRFAFKGVKTTAYKSNNVNAQQFYKPISKVLRF